MSCRITTVLTCDRSTMLLDVPPRVLQVQVHFFCCCFLERYAIQIMLVQPADAYVTNGAGHGSKNLRCAKCMLPGSVIKFESFSF